MNMSDYDAENKISVESAFRNEATRENIHFTLGIASQIHTAKLPNRNSTIPANLASVDVEYFLRKMTT
jgi:hypothetical protein